MQYGYRLRLLGISAISLGLASLLWSPNHNTSAAAAKRQDAAKDSPAYHLLKFSANMPYDVDMFQKKKLEDKGYFPQVQRLFDVLAWKTFVALNWPANPQGEPDMSKNIGDQPPLLWETWKEAYQVYRKDGVPPTPWGKPTPLPPEGPEDAAAPPAAPNARLLRMAFKPSPHDARAARGNRVDGSHSNRSDVANEVDQAFSGPLIDQNGKWVRYEVLMNRPEFDYTVDNQLYNLDGQVEFSNNHKTVNFTVGRGQNTIDGKKQSVRRGAMELKLAWKEMGAGDIRSRFLVRDCWILIQGTKDKPAKWVMKPMGLVGMHIGIKTESSPTWIWATFEQVDNVRINDLDSPPRGENYPSRPSFNDPTQPTKPVNALPPKLGKDGKTSVWDETLNTTPVQVTRVIPIPKATEALNVEAQRLLKGTVFQYYELIGTQWPTGTNPLAPAVPPGNALPYNGRNSVTNKAPGNITPTYLTNSTMETYFQVGNQPAASEEEGNSTDTTPVFGTESCTGCHYSAGIATGFTQSQGEPPQATFSGPGTADFSWLPAQMADWIKKKSADASGDKVKVAVRR